MTIEEKIKIAFPPLLSALLALGSNVLAWTASITAVLDVVLKSCGILAALGSITVSYLSYKKLKRESSHQ
jgi:hypothetical protein